MAALHTGLRELAGLWGQPLPEGAPCLTALTVGLRCLHSHGGWDELRALDRPALLVLHDLATPSYALLVGYDGAGARLRIGGQERLIQPDSLSARFDGEFYTFWRAPGDWRDEVAAGDRGAQVDRLARRLAQLGGQEAPPAGRPFGPNLQKSLRDFQLSQRLKVDGVAGPNTLIRLLEPHAGKEPRLSASQP